MYLFDAVSDEDHNTIIECTPSFSRTCEGDSFEDILKFSNELIRRAKPLLRSVMCVIFK